MSFQTGLSGLNAASRNLDVIGHNIANANTVGMKASRTEFSGLVSSALSSASSGGSGIGVEVANIAQMFTQGNISTTSNNLDVAINGSGFFQLTQNDGSPAYTRDGSFKLDKDGFLRTNTGANLMGYPTDKSGVPTSASIQKLQLPTSAPIGASATTTINAEFNLDARILDNTALTTAGKTINPRSTFGTSLNVYDEQGVASPVNFYFEKDAAANTWNIYGGLDTPALVGPPAVPAVTFPLMGSIVFNSAGNLDSLVDGTGTANATGTGLVFPAGTFASLNPNEDVGPGLIQTEITLDLTSVTQFGTAFAVSDLTQNGYTAGELTGLNIGEDGVITARYSNGETQSAGQLALADFRNIQGLIPLGGNAWAATNESGQPVQGSPGVGKFGILRSGALEESNVDLTAELVNMMTAQRAYQANAQTIKTQDQIMSTLVNLR
ncbi:MAG: flagellar hook protein FlgE [Rhodoferax sp.]|uniref:flagellar hook protein FlgE n=1 Tax=Rhodoferax sp. TaxID=50421 RepID=UPI001B437E09|nr:flagellar hook protein FlgE [Rhodoferax sp.]MBP9907128.1 flagellar hook protein FlgE [Rhodoferax sp.]